MKAIQRFFFGDRIKVIGSVVWAYGATGIFIARRSIAAFLFSLVFAFSFNASANVTKAARIISSLPSPALPISVDIHIKNASLVGKHRLIYWMFKVYDAYLYAPNGVYTGRPPYALSLKYLRSFDKKELVERTIEAMINQGFNDESKLQAWDKRLMQIFIDVNRGDYITAIAMDTGETAFFSGIKGLGYIDDPDFRKPFFDIWLGEKTSYPIMRDNLLNLDGENN